VFILDEPTAVLTPEVDELLVCSRAHQEGGSVLFITHKLREVLEVADRITIMRGGRVVASAKPEESDAQSLRRSWWDAT